MSQENVERLKRAYAGDPEPDLLAPDFELHQASSIIDTDGIFRGRDAIRDVRRELEESFEDVAHVWSYRGDTFVRMVVYEEQAEALEAVGLRQNS